MERDQIMYIFDTSGLDGHTVIHPSERASRDRRPQNFTSDPTSGTEPLEQSTFRTQVLNHHFMVWTFGDGGTQLARNPVHIYSILGHTLSLPTVTNAAGATQKRGKTDYITVTAA